MGPVLWQVTTPESLQQPINVGPGTAGFAEVDGNYLILPTPENYVGPGFNGQRTIRCNQQIQSILSSPGRGVLLINYQYAHISMQFSPPLVLAPPQFDDVTINEGDVLMISCINTNPSIVSSITLWEPNGEVVPVDLLGAFTIPSATRNYSGTYTCLITSTINNNTVMTTAEVTIQCELSHM